MIDELDFELTKEESVKKLHAYVTKMRNEPTVLSLETMGWFKLFALPAEELIKRSFDKMDYSVRVKIVRYLFVNSRSTTYIMACKEEYTKLRGIPKNDFIIAIANETGIGRNRMLKNVEEMVLRGDVKLLKRANPRYQLVTFDFTSNEKTIIDGMIKRHLNDMFSDVDNEQRIIEELVSKEEKDEVEFDDSHSITYKRKPYAKRKTKEEEPEEIVVGLDENN